MQSLISAGEHPCYSPGAAHSHARMHLPVAPACNISCNYCNRKYDCVNESRPGVTSEILTPEGAKQKYDLVKEKVKNLSVVGIAGPGDALANWPQTRRSIELIKEHNPEIIFCLSTNGLLLPDYASEIVDLGVNHVTITINCLDPEIGRLIYRSVNYRGKTYRGAEGASILLENQLIGLEGLVKSGVLVKVNSVMVNGVNDQHLPEVIKKVGAMGAFISNIMPLIPAAGSRFADRLQTSRKELNLMRERCKGYLQQMYHCQQCRADAIGLLNNDVSREFCSGAAEGSPVCGESRPRPESQKKNSRCYKIAVASKGEKMVDLHFGQAHEFAIFEGDEKGFTLLGTREVKGYCQGVELCDDRELERDAVINAIRDCDVVLSMRIGYHPRQKLASQGILALETGDTVENGLSFALRELLKQEAV